MDNFAFPNNTRSINSILELQELVLRKIQRLETQLDTNLKMLEKENASNNTTTQTTTKCFKAIANYLRVRDFEIPRLENEFNENVEKLRSLGYYNHHQQQEEDDEIRNPLLPSSLLHVPDIDEFGDPG
jgi:hypothetical protein